VCECVCARARVCDALSAQVRETYERLGSDESEEARRGDFSATPPTPPPKHLLYKADIWALGGA
jgi:hypothetical protein